MNEYGFLDKSLLKKFECDFSVQLPKGYIEFLLKNNGGSVVDGFFEIDGDKKSVSRVSLFYGFHSGHSYTRIDSCFRVFMQRLKPGFIPVACDVFGNQICLCLQSDAYASIWFLDHELSSSSASSYVFLAADIFQFYQSLDPSLSPFIGEVDEMINGNDIKGLLRLFDAGLDIEGLDENGRSILERAVIKNKLYLVKVLIGKGAKLREAIFWAKKNYKFFPEYEDMLVFLEKRANRKNN